MSYARRALLLAAFSGFAVVLVLIASASIDAQAPRTVQDGVFSDAQATRGQALYAQRCAGCHGPALAGGQAPPLAGDAFTTKWRLEPLSALFIKIRYTMPPSPPASAPAGGGLVAATPFAPQLSAEQGADLVAHVLKTNGFPAGKADFPAADAVTSTIGWPDAGAPAPAVATATTRVPTGTLNQLMRGVFFGSSNLIFSVQEIDPVKLPPQPPASRPEGLTIFDWGQSVYTGCSRDCAARTAASRRSPSRTGSGSRSG
jgi:mono/diheme cytochrome c family protein